MNKEHKDPDVIDLDAPRLAWHKQKTWKNHQNSVYWVDEFYQTRSNAIIPKAIVMETGEVLYEKVYMSPRPPPKISFNDNWMKELGSEVAGGSKDSKQTQPKTKNPIVRKGRLVKSDNHPVRVLRKSTNVSCLIAKAPM